MTSQDSLYMLRALHLAQLGGRSVQPNPMVGCVIAENEQIIGEGWHKHFGGPHAEALALQTVTKKHSLRNATVYVSLEPCTHYGKTPPCTEALIKAAPKRVVVACEDPNFVVKGRGVARLRAAGIDVGLGTLEKEAKWLNRRFFTHVNEARPYVLLKWAQSSDGFLAPKHANHAKGIHWISNTQSQQLAHLWRSQEQAILVGFRTALEDNPSLTVRTIQGTQPLRVVMDEKAALPASLRLWDETAPTLAYTHKQNPPRGYEVIDAPFVQPLLASLHAKGILSLIVEGGAATLKAFLAANTWDEARIITSPEPLHKGLPAPKLPKDACFHQKYEVCGDKIYRYFRKEQNFIRKSHFEASHRANQGLYPP